jgi:hypothetical protein
MAATVLIVACGALAHELVALQRANDWAQVRIQCLPHALHNSPGQIAGAVRAVIEREHGRYSRIFVAYGDCGTFGALDQVLQEFGIERLPGAHCYDFYAGPDVFEQLVRDEPGTFFLTDFLARNFERIVARGLGLDRHPELRQDLFGRYRRLVFLSQSGSAELRAAARRHAAYLGLEYVERQTGLQPVEHALRRHLQGWAQRQLQ